MMIEPARIAFDARGVPFAPDFDDVYHARIGAAEQARHVFLAGNGLPGRWRGRERFVVLETGFGLGNNFLAAWQAWRDDGAARCRRLHFVSIERHPPRHEDLARVHAASPWPELAQQLVAAWPPLTPDLHRLDFEGGAVRLLLAFGDVAEVLPELDLAADAVFLDGFAPAKNPAMWTPAVLKAIGRRCAAGATAATWSAARELRDGLAAAGFEVERASGIGGKREITRARFAPRFPLRERRGATGDALVIGAGLAGAATARALAAEGFAVTLLDRREQPAAEASGQPGGLFHGTVHRDDGPYARLLRAAALATQGAVQAALAAGVPGRQQGLLRLGARPGLAESQRLPAEWVEVLDADAASACAGVPLAEPAWRFPGGGWVAPAALVAWWLADPALRFIGGAAAERIERDGSLWRALDAAGRPLGAASLLVVAAAGDTQRLLAPLGFEVSLTAERGQTSGWRDGRAPPLRCPLAGDGYALPLPDGLLCGATTSADDEPALRPEDDALNLQRLRRLTGLVPPLHAHERIGRVGWRWNTADKLPLAGAVPLPLASRLQAASTRWPRHEGLYVNAGLGGRGITWAPLLGQMIAAHASSAPLPLPRSLLEAIDPLRFRLRSLRRAAY